MGKGLLIAAAGVVLGATALAFYFDRTTEEEQGMHAELRRRNDDLRQQFDASEAITAIAQTARSKQLALAIKDNLYGYCIRYRGRLDTPAQEFRALADKLKSDLADPSISPYRRNALRLLQSRLENTRNRLNAFRKYCYWYLQELDSLVEKADYDALRSFAEPLSRLPEDWYYHGKVGLVSVSDLDPASNRNSYGQILQLLQERQGRSSSDSKQRAFMLQYPDQEAIPVQLLASRNPDSSTRFDACILRGALYVEHILEKLPCTAFVIWAGNSKVHCEDGYEVRCFPSFCGIDKQQSMSGVQAFLPRSESGFPGKRYLTGEKIEVYLHHHDLLLSKDKLMVTQQRESLEFGGSSSAPIFINVDGAMHDLPPLLEEESNGAVWQLRTYVEHELGMAVMLQLGPWRVETEVCGEDGQLRVTDITHVGIDSLHLDQLPYQVRLIERKFKGSVFCDALRFQEFLQFCRQQSLFGTDDQEREVSGKFFGRWSQVTEYLSEQNGYQYFFLTPREEPDAREWVCDGNKDLDKELRRLIEEADFPPRLHFEELYANGSGGRRWLQVGELKGVPEALGPGSFRLPHGGVRRPDPKQGYRVVAPAQVRLSFPKVRELANLQRQKRALQSFMNGRLMNPALQQILMMPHRYDPKPDPFWVGRVRAGLQWQTPDWQNPTESETVKSIIEAALIESNLYLIQGPPGTGKTTCIVELLHQIFAAHPDFRILVVSQQNAAVDNALERFLKRYPEHCEAILRIGSTVAKVQPTLQGRMTDAILTDYLKGRQREYSRAALEMPARAASIQEWIESVYQPKSRRGKFDDELTELLTEDHKLVGATCVGLASRRHGMDRLKFDVCIIDEGGRSTLPELLIPLMRSRKAIIIGDHYQLPPSIARELYEADAKETLPFLEDTFLKTSFFEKLYENLPPQCRGRLQDQFRMVEPIGDLVANLFYTDKDKRCLFNGRIHSREHFLDPEHTLRWHSVNGGRQENEIGETSLFNTREAEVILDFLRVASQSRSNRDPQQGDEFRGKHVAIITPYGAQKRLIIRLLDKESKKNPEIRRMRDNIEVNTVDAFQGSEADIVLYSTVRTKGDISFLLDRQRLNVACSRARENLVFFGATKFLREYESRSGKFLFSKIIDASHCS